jgi:hypothetical protein
LRYTDLSVFNVTIDATTRENIPEMPTTENEVTAAAITSAAPSKKKTKPAASPARKPSARKTKTTASSSVTSEPTLTAPHPVGMTERTLWPEGDQINEIALASPPVFDEPMLLQQEEEATADERMTTISLLPGRIRATKKPKFRSRKTKAK